MDKMVYSVADAAGALGVCRATIHNWVRDRRIETVKVGGRRLIPVASIRDLLAKTQVAA